MIIPVTTMKLLTNAQILELTPHCSIYTPFWLPVVSVEPDVVTGKLNPPATRRSVGIICNGFSTRNKMLTTGKTYMKTWSPVLLQCNLVETSSNQKGMSRYVWYCKYCINSRIHESLKGSISICIVSSNVESVKVENISNPSDNIDLHKRRWSSTIR